MNWQGMDSAPRDGTEILVCWDDDVNWQYKVVSFNDDANASYYPWEDYADGYSEERLHYWAELEPPYKHVAT